jgi:alpha-mannosidase
MAMKIEENPNEVVNAWRSIIKNKRRMIFSFSERVEIRLSNIQEHIVKARHIVDGWQIRECYFRDLGEYEYIDDDWRTISIGELWGGPDISAFFKRHIQIPQEFAGERVALRFYIGGDSLLSVNGVPYHGLDPFRNEVLLTECATGGELLNIEVESYVNWHSDEADNKRLHLAELVTIDPEIHQAYWDFRAAFKVLAIDDLDNDLRGYLEHHLWNALKEVAPHK